MADASNPPPPPTLEYRPPLEPVTTLEWTELPGQLQVEFPIRQVASGNGCGWAMVVLISTIMLLFLVMLRGKDTLIPLIVIESILLALWWACWRTVRPPNVRKQPSTLVIQDGVLKLERVGEQGDLDVSWELGEISDIRFSRTVVMHGFSLWSLLMAPRDSWVRVSVVLPSGQIEETVFEAGPGYWIEDFETRLRAYLGLK